MKPGTLSRWMPLVGTLRRYSRADLRGDLGAGLTTAVMLIPQGMAYAMLAGLPPIYGLYASTVPLFLYALFGTSRQLAVGPVAMVSLLVATSVGAIAEQGSAEYIGYAVLLMLMVGVIQLAMGVFRLGFLVNFLSHPVVSGFTSAAALIIGFSQLKHLLGIDFPRSKHVHTVIANAGASFSDWHWLTLGIGVASVVLLVALKRWKPAFPRALAVVLLSTLGVALLGLADAGVRVVGAVPGGLPAPSFAGVDWAGIEGLLPAALAISLVGFMESISVAKAFARRHRYEVDANQELVGLGMANLVGSFFQGYPVTGGFSRTAVNDQAGARTGVAALVTAVVVVLSLLFLTPLFFYIPKSVLAAIIMVAVFGLVDFREVKHLWKVKRGDLLQLVVTFVATLSLGIEEGIAVGVATALFGFVVRTTRPHFAVLGRLPGTTDWRNVNRHPEAETVPGLLVVRMDAQFYFGNVTFLKETLERFTKELFGQERKNSLRAVVLDASAMNQLDSSADSALREIVEELRERGIDLFLANVKGPARDVMDRSGLSRLVGEDHLALSVENAVRNASALA